MSPSEYKVQLSNFLEEYRLTVNVTVTLELVLVEDMVGSADGLRAVSDRIRGDFIFVSSDLISQFPLGELANMHRLNTSVSSEFLFSLNFFHPTQFICK